MTPTDKPDVCRLVGLTEALEAFVRAGSGTEGQRHIKPMHWYVACRLVIEGGFRPEHVTPRPPFRVRRLKNRNVLEYDAAVATGGEATVFGGLKTKDVDVVVDIPGVGPCVAVSMKGTLNAFRNLTNRLEEAVGDCTNLHIAYPALLYGFVSLFRANRPGVLPPGSSFLKADPGGQVRREDLALSDSNEPTSTVANYAQAMGRLTGRRDLRDDPSRYESIAVVLVSPYADNLGSISDSFPLRQSPLRFSKFFPALYGHYDLRFVYGAPNLKGRTQRLVWDPASPAFTEPLVAGFEPRTAVEDFPPEAEPTDEEAPEE